MIEIDWESPKIKEILTFEEGGCYKNPVRWILRKFLHVIKKVDAQVFFEGQIFPELQSDEKIYGVLYGKYFFSPQSLYIKEVDKITHIPWASIIKCENSVLTLKNKKKVIVDVSELASAGKSYDISNLFYDMIHYWSSIPRKIIKCKYKGLFDLQQISKEVPKDLRQHLYHENSALTWQKMIACSCGSEYFQAFYHYHEEDEEDFKDEDVMLDNALIKCEDCKKSYLLFDADLHGWNALSDLCDTKRLPAPKSYDNAYQCNSCGSLTFSLIVDAEYVRDEIPEMKRSLKKLFGKQEGEKLVTYALSDFGATAICKQCKKVHLFVGHECA